jgi:hypothetical protein
MGRDIGDTRAVTDRRRSHLNLNVLLEAVEAAPPVAAAEVIGDALGEALGARDVSFLIADYSGQSLIRLPRGEAATILGDGRGDPVPLRGTPHGRALAEQEVQVVAEDDGARLFAPVTSRGEAVGVLELALEANAYNATNRSINGGRHASWSMWSRTITIPRRRRSTPDRRPCGQQ